jgi:hypothetical protein
MDSVDNTVGVWLAVVAGLGLFCLKIGNEYAMTKEYKRQAVALERLAGIDATDRTGRSGMFRQRALLRTDSRGESFLDPIECNEQFNGTGSEAVVCTVER